MSPAPTNTSGAAGGAGVVGDVGPGTGAGYEEPPEVHAAASVDTTASENPSIFSIGSE